MMTCESKRNIQNNEIIVNDKHRFDDFDEILRVGFISEKEIEGRWLVFQHIYTILVLLFFKEAIKIQFDKIIKTMLPDSNSHPYKHHFVQAKNVYNTKFGQIGILSKISYISKKYIIDMKGKCFMKKYEMDYINEDQIEQLVITSDYNLIGDHYGTVHVENGTLTISGELHGTIDIQNNTKVIIFGKQHGTVSLGSNALLIIHGELHGTTNFDYNSNVIVEEGGKLIGTMTNNGMVIVRGIFGGAKAGNGILVVEGNGYIKQPIMKNGISYYQW